ncbi:MAG: YIP1 family protein [bacterium]
MATDPPPIPRRPLILAPSGGPIINRLVSALMLRPEFYAAAAADVDGTGATGAIICLIALLRDSPFLYHLSQTEPAWGLALLLTALLALLRWAAVGLFALAVSRLARTRPTYRSLLRVLAYAEAPTLLIAFDPWLPPASQLLYLPDIAMNVWTFTATLIAMRAATQTSLMRAAWLAVPIYLVQRITLVLVSQ